MREFYPSDISREQFSKIEPLLISARKRTRPRELDLYDVFCAILYLLKTACQWRMLPKDFPKWRSVHAYFQIWSKRVDDQPSLLEHALKKIGSRNSR
jgi:transposase